MTLLQRLLPKLHTINLGAYRILIRKKSELNQILRKSEVIPDVITCPPAYELKVTYGDRCLKPGCELKPKMVKSPPQLSWTCAQHDVHTIMMLDPDAPSRTNPKNRNWLHWLVGNVRGQDVAKGKTLVEYVGAAPPPDTGLHRYVLLIFKQVTESDFCGQPIIPKTKADGRTGFKVQTFAAQHNLCCLSSANFFHAKFDCYVCDIYKQLGMEM